LPDNSFPGAAKSVLSLIAVRRLGPSVSSVAHWGNGGFSMPTRTYDVVALQVPIVHDTYGDHDRRGMIYALAQHAEEVRAIRENWPKPFPDPVEFPGRVPQPHPLVRPLVLRAGLGDQVVVRFRNELPRRVGIHPQGVCAEPESGAEPDGGTRRYVWRCDEEGVFFFGGLADPRGDEAAHGLFGALVVEPAEATWTDPVTGGPADGLYADVHVPGEPSFREYALFMHDETSDDNPVPQPTSECDLPRLHGHSTANGEQRLAASMMLMSYRTEPMGWRALAYEKLLAEGRIDPVRDAMIGAEQRHSSWLFGDPASPIFRAYRGDRAKIRLVHAGMAGAHIFHLHLHQWRAVPGAGNSPITDSVTISPRQAFTIEPIGGAGSVQRAIGDIIWHCHPYPRFHSGMWGMWRVFDVLQDGTGRYPDGTVIDALRPLPGHDQPSKPTAERPGFPAFIPGEFPQQPPRPPRTPLMPEGMGREPTEAERASFCPDPQPGEAFTEVALDPDAPVRRYDVVVLEATVRYCRGDASHSARRHDHRGVCCALREEIDEAGGIEEFCRQLERGERELKPIAIRAGKGDVVQLSLTNALPADCREGTAFDQVLPFRPECGMHVRLVKFDPLVADGASVGWNYLPGTRTADISGADHANYETWVYRWYCDEEFGVVFLQDRASCGVLPSVCWSRRPVD
jgi:FtsP/CotA-like multicopper oxidase with cupredoxin domain